MTPIKASFPEFLSDDFVRLAADSAPVFDVLISLVASDIYVCFFPVFE